MASWIRIEKVNDLFLEVFKLRDKDDRGDYKVLLHRGCVISPEALQEAITWAGSAPDSFAKAHALEEIETALMIELDAQAQ